MHPKMIFIDLEPAGHDPRRHPIIQIAAIAVNQELEEVEAFEAKVQFEEALATKASLRKASYSRARWAREAVHPRTAAKELTAFLKSHATIPVLGLRGRKGNVAQLAAHNAEFDNAFIQTWYQRHGMYYPARFQMLCTLQRAEWFFAERLELPRPDNMRLLTLCQYFRVPLHPFEAHDALADVRATIGLYRAIREWESFPTAATPRLRSAPARMASRFVASS